MAKDLIDDRFGRLWHFTQHWANGGHDVRVLCLSYTRKFQGLRRVDDVDGKGSLEWTSMNAGALRVPNLYRYYSLAHRTASSFQPDVVVASSDSLYIVLGQRIAAACGAMFVADLYDDYEVFAAARIPSVKSLYRRALRQAHLVTCISEPLRHQIQHGVGCRGVSLVVENAVDNSAFYPRDKSESREHFKLPPDSTIIGTAGALSETRGIEVLYDAFISLARTDESVVLAVAGPRDVAIPDHPRLFDLGELAWSEVPAFLSALDIGVVCNKDTQFARYCFPQKAFEMLACGVTVVGADIGVMSNLFGETPQYLFKPEDPESLEGCLHQAIAQPARSNISIPTWNELSQRMEEAMVDQLTQFTISHG